MVLLFTDNCWPTENLILKSGRKHYRTNIAPWHWQLRSLISAEGNNTVYFPTGVNNNYITRLNTETRESETIKILSFHPRCLVAQGGWVCCGGENGEFALIKDVDQHGNNENRTRTNVDDALSSNFQSQLRSLESPPGNDPSLNSSFSREMFNLLEQRLNGPAKTWTSSNHKYGSERVNCITIWEPPKATSLFSASTGHYATPVAVLSNNDKTVTIVGLHDGEFLDEIDLPDCVNRSIISPDGTLLASICDDPFLYLHTRKSVNKGKIGEYYEWKLLPRVRLESPAKNARDDCRGSFAASFSPSGRYLAIGVQNGTVRVFDVAALQSPDSDPHVASFATSRHPEVHGAVRDMAFCPGPYDLLAWTEHRGRIGIADARSNFNQRQIISLDQQDDYEHLSLNDRSTIDPRLLEQRNSSEQGNGRSSSHLARLLSQANSPQPPAHTTSNAEVTERVNHPFTSEETAILDALADQRRRREAQEAREQIAQEIARGGTSWRSSLWAERVSPPPQISSYYSSAEVRPTPLSPEGRTFRDRAINQVDIALTIARQRETLTRILERERRDARDAHRTAVGQNPSAAEQERERRAPTPRRRSSIMQALNQESDRAVGGAPSTLSRIQSSGNNETGGSRDSPTPWSSGRLTSGWADLEALYNITGGDGAGSSDNIRVQPSRTRRAIPVINDAWNDDLAGFGTRRSYPRLSSRDHTQHPDDTAGLTWSDDGLTLWVGAEDGVYEFKINLQGRKTFPEITLR
ncbi:hypothetical protein AB5N19_11074 [Seiridium cardinale]|uniref:DUF2415 domain-containing protein n=1 Tax=Seiridium cardinale TaxID=138064 RepID=A0ABR2XIJ0_9PEZI